MTDGMHHMRQKCLPTYLVIDVSTSMSPHEQTLNQTLKKLHSTLANSPRVSEFAHMSIIAFSTQPWVVIEMTDMEYVPGMPEVACDGMTGYGAAFDLVRERIDIDLPALTAQGKAVLRPIMFFLTDGAPTDGEWENAFRTLVDKGRRRRPHVVTYGFGAAPEEVLSRIATKAAFVADGSSGQDEALSTALHSMLNSLVASAQADELLIPAQASGYKSVPLEYLD
ncbi:VWA domain-containing protein [Actinoplanes sp. NPDC026670]|uniref:vWA domain-containing protein n=1 Tax=Actinoplanes sp. NPDC026670 TaxID=3154700 RepID=UPI0033D1EE14